MRQPEELTEKIFRAAIRAVDPYKTVRQKCPGIRCIYQNGDYERLVTLGFGKAAVPMARALEDGLDELLESGLAVTKYGHTSSIPLEKIRVLEAGHPLPDENGIRATEEIIRLAASADERTLVVALVSGGGSALLTSPVAGVSLDAKRRTTDLLLRGGADIHALNTVRKHLSRVKGGRLAETIYPGRTVSLILSDVIGDNPEVIASGPTAPDSTTFGEALAILERLDLAGRIPPEVETHIAAGATGKIPETPKWLSPAFNLVDNRIIGSNRTALEAAAEVSRAFGCSVEILPDAVQGEASEAGRMLAALARARKVSGSAKPLCLLAGGETTVTVKGKGTGGRNMELALAFALEIAGVPGITLLSAGTDGGDGPTDAAGALVDGNSIKVAGRDTALARLADNDSYTFFRENGGLFITGPTGTNVMDIQIILVE